MVSFSTVGAFDGMACGYSSSNTNMQECGDCSNRLPFRVELAVFALKSRVTPCVVRKSQPKITGVDNFSTTTKVWSTVMMPRSKLTVMVPRGVNFLPSAFIRVIVPDFTRSACRERSACMTEQDAPESSNINVSKLFILPATQAVLMVLECEGESAGKQSTV